MNYCEMEFQNMNFLNTVLGNQSTELRLYSIDSSSLLMLTEYFEEMMCLTIRLMLV